MTNSNKALNYGQIEQIKQLITVLIDTHENLKHQQKLLLSIPGVGELTAAKLQTSVEIGTYDSASLVSAHAGVTPRQQVSGSTVRGKTRLCKTGNAKLRKALYMPAMSARRFNPVRPAFCDRLLEKGKAKRAIRSNASIGQQGAGRIGHHPIGLM
ncbi:MAG: IS110 family transposase [Hormoscilla sp. GUM202]|nr:IS110 family transposase [Hormoscilla sp. GUM202]